MFMKLDVRRLEASASGLDTIPIRIGDDLGGSASFDQIAHALPPGGVRERIKINASGLWDFFRDFLFRLPAFCSFLFPNWARAPKTRRVKSADFSGICWSGQQDLNLRPAVPKPVYRSGLARQERCKSLNLGV